MARTITEQLREALIAKGETLVKRLHTCEIYTRKEGGYYYLGSRGSLRIGITRVGSLPCGNKFKAVIIQNYFDTCKGSNYA